MHNVYQHVFPPDKVFILNVKSMFAQEPYRNTLKLHEKALVIERDAYHIVKWNVEAHTDFNLISIILLDMS